MSINILNKITNDSDFIKPYIERNLTYTRLITEKTKSTNNDLIVKSLKELQLSINKLHPISKVNKFILSNIFKNNPREEVIDMSSDYFTYSILSNIKWLDEDNTYILKLKSEVADFNEEIKYILNLISTSVYKEPSQYPTVGCTQNKLSSILNISNLNISLLETVYETNKSIIKSLTNIVECTVSTIKQFKELSLLNSTTKLVDNMPFIHALCTNRNLDRFTRSELQTYNRYNEVNNNLDNLNKLCNSCIKYLSNDKSGIELYVHDKLYNYKEKSIEQIMKDKDILNRYINLSPFDESGIELDLLKLLYTCKHLIAVDTFKVTFNGKALSLNNKPTNIDNVFTHEDILYLANGKVENEAKILEQDVQVVLNIIDDLQYISTEDQKQYLNEVLIQLVTISTDTLLLETCRELYTTYISEMPIDFSNSVDNYNFINKFLHKAHKVGLLGFNSYSDDYNEALKRFIDFDKQKSKIIIK